MTKPVYDPSPVKRYVDMTVAERAKAYEGLLEADTILCSYRPDRRSIERNTRERLFLLRVAKSRADAWAVGV